MEATVPDDFFVDRRESANIQARIRELLEALIRQANATRGVFILEKNNRLVVEAESNLQTNTFKDCHSMLMSELTDEFATSIIYHVARTQEIAVLSNAAGDSVFAQDHYIKTHQPMSLMCLPAHQNGKPVAILYLENDLIPDAFASQSPQSLQLLQNHFSFFVENVLLFEQIKQTAGEIQRNEEYSRALIEHALDIITIVDRDGTILYGSPAIQRVLGYQISELVGRNTVEFVHPQDHQVILDALTRALDPNHNPTHIEFRFRHKDGSWRTLEAIGNNQLNDGRIGGIIVNARDITERKQAERERVQFLAIQRELVFAQEIQQSLLQPPKPAWPDLDLICYSRPAKSMGGDLYAYSDFAHASDISQDDKFAVVVGDASGKGMPAALLMAVSLVAFQSSITQNLSPGQLLTRLDQTIEHYTGTNRQNCAMVCVEITLPAQSSEPSTIRVANAGCISPIVRRCTGTLEWVEARGLPLGTGIGTFIGYSEITIVCDTGDFLIITSDGVIEAQNVNSEMFGFERLEDAVATGPQTSAEVMLNHLRNVLDTFLNNTEPNDDITIVVVRF